MLMVFEVTENAIECSKVTDPGCAGILGEGAKGILDIETSESDAPVCATDEGAVKRLLLC